ncbi:MAG: hypothetical protein GY765_00090 [bacterium]|nr:hypothetical protein [bacterium]
MMETSIPNLDKSGYAEELNRQCRVLMIPASLMALVSWIPFIKLDTMQYPGISILLYFRLGLTVVGAVALVLYFVPFFRVKSMLILFSIVCYVEFSAAIILGMVTADPVYMGGLSMVVLMIPVMPFQRSHSLILFSATILVFSTTGLYCGMTFSSPRYQYGLFNLMAAGGSSLIAIFVLDYVRRQRYIKSIIIARTNERIRNQAVKLAEAFEKIRTLSGLLPICSSCKSIRDSEGYWHKLESYIEVHSNAAFSHSLCADCFKKLYPQMVGRLDAVDDV